MLITFVATKCDKLQRYQSIWLVLSYLFYSVVVVWRTLPILRKFTLKLRIQKLILKFYQIVEIFIVKIHGTINSWSFSKSRDFFTPSQWLVLLKKALHYSKLHRKEAWSSITFVPILEHMVIFELHFLKIYMHYKGFLYYYMM